MNRRRSEALGKALAPLRETGAPTAGSGPAIAMSVRSTGPQEKRRLGSITTKRFSVRSLLQA